MVGKIERLAGWCWCALSGNLVTVTCFEVKGQLVESIYNKTGTSVICTESEMWYITEEKCFSRMV